jgi:hypothetical protein
MSTNDLSKEYFWVDFTIIFFQNASNTGITRWLNSFIPVHNTVHLWVRITIDIVGIIEDLNHVMSVFNSSEGIIIGGTDTNMNSHCSVGLVQSIDGSLDGSFELRKISKNVSPWFA